MFPETDVMAKPELKAWSLNGYNAFRTTVALAPSLDNVLYKAQLRLIPALRILVARPASRIWHTYRGIARATKTLCQCTADMLDLEQGCKSTDLSDLDLRTHVSRPNPAPPAMSTTCVPTNCTRCAIPGETEGPACAGRAASLFLYARLHAEATLHIHRGRRHTAVNSLPLLSCRLGVEFPAPVPSSIGMPGMGRALNSPAIFRPVRRLRVGRGVASSSRGTLQAFSEKNTASPPDCRMEIMRPSLPILARR
ncbi:hypothetical protein LY78DRAFT_61281 [Colletotrichum sublineola]|nr:hypothetical protein LY78DRAFT_61281 [Colletotrichum sublineola]